ncbi:MAG TPA: type II CAAX endopeptidase family protein [Rhizomicrobium sp.]|nr:type II CAAX endopeptidase family protein [Rhizomicrobium sp.]
MNRDTSLVRPRRRLSRIALVRLIFFFFPLIAVYGGAQGGFAAAVKYIPANLRDIAMIAAAAAMLVVMVIVYTLLVRRLERRKVQELWPVRGFSLAIGVILALLAMCAIYAVLGAMGVARWRGISGFGGVETALIVAVVSGIGEELIFRGGFFRILEDSMGTAIALILSSAVFGATHLLNPHATPWAAMAIALEAGVVLGAAYSATRSLWLPIGIHIGWNFAEGGVFGGAVSGRFGGHGIFDVPLSGPGLLTGGAFGPETSVVAAAICFVLGLFFVLQTIRRGRWVPLSFHMMLD